MDKTDVYGMLVAQDPLENYWVVPMDEILQDLREELTAVDVSLITSREVLLAIRERQKKIDIDLIKQQEAIPQDKDLFSLPVVTRVPEVRVRLWDAQQQPGTRRAASRKEVEMLPDWEKKVWYPHRTERVRGKETGKEKLTRMVREHAALQRELGIRRLSDLSQADTLINPRTPSEGSSGQPSRPNTAHLNRGDAAFLSFDNIDDEDAQGILEEHEDLWDRGADSNQDIPAYTNIRTPQMIMAERQKRREQREAQEQRDRQELAAPITTGRQEKSAEPLLTPPPDREAHGASAHNLYDHAAASLRDEAVASKAGRRSP